MSDSDYDYMVTETDQGVLKNLSQMGDHLKELKLKMIKAEAEYEAAKKEHDYYASSVLPMAMFNAGVNSITLASGGVLSCERKFYCQPNKNETDKQAMAEWLRAHGGEDLIKEKASVDGAQIDKLKEAGIPFTEIDDINTNSLKAFLKSKIGAATGSTVELQITDIPACMHFQEVSIASVDI